MYAYTSISLITKVMKSTTILFLQVGEVKMIVPPRCSVHYLILSVNRNVSRMGCGTNFTLIKLMYNKRGDPSEYENCCVI